LSLHVCLSVCLSLSLCLKLHLLAIRPWSSRQQPVQFDARDIVQVEVSHYALQRQLSSHSTVEQVGHYIIYLPVTAYGYRVASRIEYNVKCNLNNDIKINSRIILWTCV